MNPGFNQGFDVLRCGPSLTFITWALCHVFFFFGRTWQTPPTWLTRTRGWTGLILSSPITGSHTIVVCIPLFVFRYLYSATKKSGVYCVRNIEEVVFIQSKEYLDRNVTIFTMFRTQYIPDFFVGEHCGLRNTIPPGGLRISPLDRQTVSYFHGIGTTVEYKGTFSREKWVHPRYLEQAFSYAYTNYRSHILKVVLYDRPSFPLLLAYVYSTCKDLSQRGPSQERLEIMRKNSMWAAGSSHSVGESIQYFIFIH
jgi:hypothetical protein